MGSAIRGKRELAPSLPARTWGRTGVGEAHVPFLSGPSGPASGPGAGAVGSRLPALVRYRSRRAVVILPLGDLRAAPCSIGGNPPTFFFRINLPGGILHSRTYRLDGPGLPIEPAGVCVNHGSRIRAAVRVVGRQQLKIVRGF